MYQTLFILALALTDVVFICLIELAETESGAIRPELQMSKIFFFSGAKSSCFLGKLRSLLLLVSFLCGGNFKIFLHTRNKGKN